MPRCSRRMARLHDEGPPVHLVVVGDGEERARLEELAGRLGLGQRIHFLGWRADLETILKELDVVICASRNEGTPVALIEAMAAGDPGTVHRRGRRGGPRGARRDGVAGAVGRPADAMASAIRRLLGDEILARSSGGGGTVVALDRHESWRA